ncbi:hypothetical protein BC826DRAFT_997699 [Russula brevipes]|nr:hypothetical protein BC826DRAFT_997699 [Russula brevipes]
MYGRSGQTCRWDVPHVNDRKQRIDRISHSRVSSAAFTGPSTQTQPLHSTKRRRIYGLNSRFDHMLQEVSWVFDSSKPFLPRRKHHYSSGTSPITSHDLSNGPGSDGSRNLAKWIVPAMSEKLLSEVVPSRTYSHPSQVEKTGDQVGVEPPRQLPLPEWLNDTLATLPPSYAVRCLALPPDHSVSKDNVDRNPDASEEGSVFAFQAPAARYDPGNHVRTEEHPKADVATFTVVRDGSDEIQGCCPTGSLTRTVPFSTPGPGWAIPDTPPPFCPRRTSSALSISPPTGIDTWKVLDTPLPFSKPGPFVPARHINDHVLDWDSAMQSHAAHDKVFPVVERSGTPSFPSSRVSKTNGVDVPLSPIQGNGKQFPGSFSLSPKITLNDASRPLSSLGPVLTRYSSENPSSPISEIVPMFPKDQLGLTRNSPTVAVTRRSGATDNPGCGKPEVFLSDIHLDQEHSYGAFPQILFPLASSPNGDTESLSDLHQPHVAPIGISAQLRRAPSSLLSTRLSTDFGWVSSDPRIPGIPGSIGSIHGVRFDGSDGAGAHSPVNAAQWPAMGRDTEKTEMART